MTKEQLAKLGITIEAETITDEEAFALIEKHHNELASEKAKLKKRTDELSSEIAQRKKADEEKLSEDEKNKLHYQEMEKEIASLKRKDSLNTKINDLLALGYDKELAKKYAEAELDGKSTVEFQRQFIEAKLEAQKQELLKNGKVPQVNNPDGKPLTKEDVIKGGMEAMTKLAKDNPQQFEEWFGKE